MTNTDIVRAWKNAEFRRELRDAAPASPAGERALTPAELERLSGGVAGYGGRTKIGGYTIIPLCCPQTLSLDC